MTRPSRRDVRKRLDKTAARRSEYPPLPVDGTVDLDSAAFFDSFGRRVYGWLDASFVVDRDDDDMIYVVDPDGTHVARLWQAWLASEHERGDYVNPLYDDGD